ncbi:MAG: hypothetical protein ACTSQF_13995, partial [Candidatus Heimdallarchaeaceae archaeon]
MNKEQDYVRFLKKYLDYEGVEPEGFAVKDSYHRILSGINDPMLSLVIIDVLRNKTYGDPKYKARLFDILGNHIKSKFKKEAFGYLLEQTRKFDAQAIETFVQIDHPKVKRFIPQILSEDYHCIDALKEGLKKSKRNIDVIINDLSNDNWNIKEQALDIFRTIRENRSVDPIIDVFHSVEDWAHKQTCLWALNNQRDFKATKFILQNYYIIDKEKTLFYDISEYTVNNIDELLELLDFIETNFPIGLFNHIKRFPSNETLKFLLEWDREPHYKVTKTILEFKDYIVQEDLERLEVELENFKIENLTKYDKKSQSKLEIKSLSILAFLGRTRKHEWLLHLDLPSLFDNFRSFDEYDECRIDKGIISLVIELLGQIRRPLFSEEQENDALKKLLEFFDYVTEDRCYYQPLLESFFIAFSNFNNKRTLQYLFSFIEGDYTGEYMEHNTYWDFLTGLEILSNFDLPETTEYITSILSNKIYNEIIRDPAESTAVLIQKLARIFGKFDEKLLNEAYEDLIKEPSEEFISEFAESVLLGFKEKSVSYIEKAFTKGSRELRGQLMKILGKIGSEECLRIIIETVRTDLRFAAKDYDLLISDYEIWDETDSSVIQLLKEEIQIKRPDFEFC